MTTALTHQDHPAGGDLDTLDKPRRAGVIVGGLIAALSFPTMIYVDSAELPAFSVLLGGSLIATIPMALRGGLGSQVLSRALWWQGALMGILFFLGLGVRSGSVEGIVATTALSFGCVTALASAGSAGLAQHSARFEPVAFRGGLMLSMVLALADTQALLLYGSIMLSDGGPVTSKALPFFASASVMMLALWGLWNMRMWGFLLNIAANIVIAGLALSGVFDLPGVLIGGLVATAVAQLLIPIPMIRAMLPARRSIGT
jgi:hypothetical protein